MLPVINQNDSIATDEISVGDNDSLGAIVAASISADLLILLSDIDGLYTADPHTVSDATLIPLVTQLTPEIERAAGGKGTQLGTGGMATKLHAAKICMEAGTDMIIANGANPEILYDILEGRQIGTRFAARRLPHDNT